MDEQEPPKKVNKPVSRALLPQIMLLVACYGSCIVTGYTSGHTAVLLPRLQQNDSSLPTDQDMASWIASVSTFIIPIGSFTGGALADTFGRRTVLRGALVPYTIGTLLVAGAVNHVMLIVGRCVQGFGRGMIGETVIVLLDEHSDPKLRGSIMCVMLVFYVGGMFAVTGLATVLQWRVVAGLVCVMTPPLAIVLQFVPETPVWLVRHGKTAEAKNVLEQVWGKENKAEAAQELHKLVAQCEEQDSKNKRHSSKIFEPNIIRPFFISFALLLIITCSGVHLFVFYSVDIISRSTRGQHKVMNSYTAATVTSVIRVLVIAVMAYFIFVVRRRTIALWSCTGTSVCTLALGTVLYLNSRDSFMSDITQEWVVLILLILFVVTSTAGLFLLGFIMLGEMMPSRVRGFCTGLAFLTNDFINAGLVKVFPFVCDNLEMHGVFWTFGLCGLAGSVFIYLFLPETKGVPLGEIENYFLQDNFIWHKRERPSLERNVLGDPAELKLIGVE